MSGLTTISIGDSRQKICDLMFDLVRCTIYGLVRRLPTKRSPRVLYRWGKTPHQPWDR